MYGQMCIVRGADACGHIEVIGKFCYVLPPEIHSEYVRVLVPNDQSGSVPQNNNGLYCSIKRTDLEPIEQDWSI